MCGDNNCVYSCAYAFIFRESLVGLMPCFGNCPCPLAVYFESCGHKNVCEHIYRAVPKSYLLLSAGILGVSTAYNGDGSMHDCGGDSGPCACISIRSDTPTSQDTWLHGTKTIGISLPHNLCHSSIAPNFRGPVNKGPQFVNPGQFPCLFWP